MEIIAAILKRPMIEIAELAGMVLVIISALGFFIVRILMALHIKKIGVTGIECETTPKPRRKLFKRSK